MTDSTDDIPEPGAEAGSDESRSGHRFSRVWPYFKWALIAGVGLFVIVLIFIVIWTIRATSDLPSVETLSEYEPPVMSRVHAGDGKLISEFRTEARVFVPIEAVPQRLQRAFVSSEDQRFYSHNGWDPIGLTRAALSAPMKMMRDERIGGTSTITQQVAKNFLVGDDYSIKRKVREIAIARRMEEAFEKDEILELYLNDNYFGRGAYGVAAAALNHFGKEMGDLTLGEMAYLALVVKGPANYELDDPEEYATAKARQFYVLNRMAEDGYITQEEADAAFAEPLEWTDRLTGDEYLAAEYFVEEARKAIYAQYGEDELYSGGLSIRTTLDTEMQLAGRRALRRGLEMLDRRMGWRGPLAQLETLDDWATQLREFERPADIGDWRVAVVLSTTDASAELGFIEDIEDDESGTERGTLALSDIRWAGEARENGRKGDAPTSMTSVVAAKDIILVQRKIAEDGAELPTEYNLRQIPEVNGGLIAMDPHTGRIETLIGGYSFEQNQYNRVTQAKRQPGSSFKPFVYAAALQNGYTPATQVLDAPFVSTRADVDCVENEFGVLELRDTIEDREEDDGSTPALEDQCERFYKPSNYNAGRYYGLSTLRLGIEKSRNAMTVRLASDIGMAPIMNISRRFGIYDNPRPELAWALGAGETTLMRLATAYSSMINGGKKVEPSIIDRVQDGQGRTIYLTSDLTCLECQQEEYTGQEPPQLPDERERIIDPITAYQVTYMMVGAVENGTGARLRALGRPVGGKTGTTNDSKDNWFMAFTPDLVVGVYVGKDTPSQMANETGSSSAVPIVLDFMQDVLADEPAVPFRIPDGLTLAPVNRDTGEPSFIGGPNVILEAFRPGTEPTVGGLTNTIRIGSGGDTFGSGFFGSGDNAGSTQSDGTQSPTGDGQRTGGLTPLPGDPILGPDGEPLPEGELGEIDPDAEEEPVDELDDGLY